MGEMLPQSWLLAACVLVVSAAALFWGYLRSSLNRSHNKKHDGDNLGPAGHSWQQFDADRVRRRVGDTPGVDVPPPFGPAAGFLGSSPPQMPLFVNAKQQKILQGVRGVPMPSRQTVELKPADSGSEEPAADPPEAPVVSEESEEASKQFGRTQFVQVFHNTPLVKPRLGSMDATAGVGGTRRTPKPAKPSPSKQEPGDASAPGPMLSTAGKEARIPTSNFEIPFDSIRLGDLIGQGAFGRVHKGTWRGTPVAVKVLVCQLLSPDVVEEFRGEIAVLSALRHPNVVLFMGAVTVAPNYCIITELVSRGSLWGVLHSSTPLDWPTCLKMAVDVCRGMAFLHSAVPSILHRDLKSGNLLVDDAFNTKLTDFGLARVKAYTQTMTGSCGTYQWMAPEVLGNMRYTEKADVFSFAVVCWELLTRKCPFESMNQIQMAIGVLHQGMREIIPPTAHPKFAFLIQRCWNPDPALRPSFLESLEELESIRV